MVRTYDMGTRRLGSISKPASRKFSQPDASEREFNSFRVLLFGKFLTKGVEGVSDVLVDHWRRLEKLKGRNLLV